MKKIALFVITMFLLTACGGDDNETSSGSTVRNPYPEATIITIGDSICNGQTASLGWADLIRNRGYAVLFKECKNGRLVLRMGSLLPDLIETYQPTHVLIMLGTNDAINGHSTEAVAALQSLVREAADRGVIPVIATIPPSSRSAEIAHNTRIINSGIRALRSARVAEANGSISVDMLNDGVHPNDIGQEIIVDAFVSKLR